MSSNSLEEIYDYFKDIEGNVNLAKMKSKIEEDKSIKSTCSILVQKLNKPPKAIMRRQQFIDYFDYKSTNPAHLDAVFDSIDKDGSKFISKKELEELMKKYGINCTTQERRMMIEVCSKDGQKVAKEDLIRFLSS